MKPKSRTGKAHKKRPGEPLLERLVTPTLAFKSILDSRQLEHLKEETLLKEEVHQTKDQATIKELSKSIILMCQYIILPVMSIYFLITCLYCYNYCRGLYDRK